MTSRYYRASCIFSTFSTVSWIFSAYAFICFRLWLLSAIFCNGALFSGTTSYIYFQKWQCTYFPLVIIRHMKKRKRNKMIDVRALSKIWPVEYSMYILVRGAQFNFIVILRTNVVCKTEWQYSIIQWLAKQKKNVQLHSSSD